MSRSASAVAALVLATGVAVVGVALRPADAAAPSVTPYSTTGVYAEGGLLPNGRLVDPPAPRVALGDFPVAVSLSPDGRTAVVANSGEGEGAPEQGNESLQVIDVAHAKVVQTVRDHEADLPTFYEAGLAWSPDGRHLYATGGGNDQVYDYAVSGRRLSLAHRYRSSAKAGARPSEARGSAACRAPPPSWVTPARTAEVWR